MWYSAVGGIVTLILGLLGTPLPAEAQQPKMFLLTVLNLNFPLLLGFAAPRPR